MLVAIDVARPHRDRDDDRGEEIQLAGRQLAGRQLAGQRRLVRWHVHVECTSTGRDSDEGRRVLTTMRDGQIGPPTALLEHGSERAMKPKARRAVAIVNDLEIRPVRVDSPPERLEQCLLGGKVRGAGLRREDTSLDPGALHRGEEHVRLTQRMHVGEVGDALQIVADADQPTISSHLSSTSSALFTAIDVTSSTNAKMSFRWRS